MTESFNSNPPKCLNRIGITAEIFANNNKDKGLTYLIDYNDDTAETILKDAGIYLNTCMTHSL